MRIYPIRNQIILEAQIINFVVSKLFKRNFGIVGTGYYYLPHSKCRCQLSIEYTDGPQKISQSQVKESTDARWKKDGLITQVPITATPKKLFVKIQFTTTKPIDFFGFSAGAIDDEYFIKNDVYTSFLQKTHLYIPEILCKDPVSNSSRIAVTVGKISATPGAPIVCKSCNRCSRLLPVDIYAERNTLSFSNHCVSRAPCTHASFSQYKLESGDGAVLGNKVKEGCVHSHYGHQLECIVCKKFFVNSPLNPLRNSTQHREDSLRRRALEVLVTNLLERRWIYHIYRMTKGKEFDVAIWEKFGKRCFKCKKTLSTPNEMDLDHTLPLAYLWPLDETATCLCSTCNSSKSDKFPLDFYNSDERKVLSKVTKIPLEHLEKREINSVAVEELLKKVVWFFDDFLAEEDYQKIRHGKKAADLILHALHNVMLASGYDINLPDAYQAKKGSFPTTVTSH